MYRAYTCASKQTRVYTRPNDRPSRKIIEEFNVDNYPDGFSVSVIVLALALRCVTLRYVTHADGANVARFLVREGRSLDSQKYS